MIIFRDYNKEKRLDRVWYESSNIFYSECDDKENDFKTLRVVFKNGATYQYENLDVNDYLMFIRGGVDGSNGKALNEFVKKKKYEYARLDNMDKQVLLEEMEQIKTERQKAKQQETETKKDEEQ